LQPDQHKRVKTTLAKAKAARPLAEKLVTLGKSGTLHDRRLAVAKIWPEGRRERSCSRKSRPASRTARAVTPASSSSAFLLLCQD
jgi:ribosomal protein L17